MFTILAALNDEIKLIRAEMEVDKVIRIRPFVISIGKYMERRICLVATGVGKEAMKTAISYCIKNQRPTFLMNIGYAGGLIPQLGAGDILIAKTVIDEATEKSWNVDEGLIKEALDVAGSAEIRYHAGGLVTVDRPLSEPHQKAFTGTRFEASACDMESSSLAEAASEASIPYLVVRSILDPLDTTLPEIPEGAVIGGEIRVGELIKHLKSRPKDLLKIPRFSYLCNQARISLTNFVKEWVRNRGNEAMFSPSPRSPPIKGGKKRF